MATTHLLSPSDILWNVLDEYGYDAESIFMEQGIDREMILKSGKRIAHDRVHNLWSKINELIKDPCLGLRGVKYWHPSHFNALGYAWLASCTLREALERVIRYGKITGDDRETTLKDTAKGLNVTFSRSLKMPIYMDMTMSIFISACRLNYGSDLNPVDVNFIHSKPVCAEEFYSFFNAPVNFDADSDSFTLPADAVDRRLPVGNPHIANLNDQYIIGYLAEIDKNNIVQRVKAEIIDMLPSGGASVEKISNKLNMSTRSLQRKLNNKNTTFGKLLDMVRQELAEHYIRDSSVSLKEIAYILGYSEYNSFWRAYKRWTKSAPSDIRNYENKS